jgi:hypothetical protein
MCKAKIFSGGNTPGPPLKGKGRGGVERKGMKEWRREKDWGGERRGREWEGREGKGRRLGGEGREVQREERRGRERRGGNERRKVGWGSIASCSQGG